MLFRSPDSERFDHLCRSSIFGKLADSHLWELVHCSTWSRQPPRSVLLREDEAGQSMYLLAAGDIKVTVSLDILAALGRGDGPEPALVALGYAGWGRGQLEAEIEQSSWLMVPADPVIVFETPFEQRWAAALGLPGVDIRSITNYAGHA